MAETPLLQRLDGLDARFQEIGTLITDPQVIADQARYVKLTKEYKSLENLLEVTNRYKKLLADIDDAKVLLDEESDDDLRAMAKDEIDADSASCRNSRRRLSCSLFPKIPKTRKTPFLKYAAVPVATRPPSLQATWPACTCATASRRAGRWRCRAAARALPAASRK